MSTKYLGGENILRQVYDESAESLRTTAVASFAGGSVDVVISHLTDSIRIGDGVDFLAINSDGSINANITGSLAVEIDAADGDNIAISDGTNDLVINVDGSINVNAVGTNTILTSIDGKIPSGLSVIGGKLQVEAPLPVGAATEAKQDVGNTSLASIDSKTPNLGQAVMAASVPVTIASDQPALNVNASLADEPIKMSGTEDGLPNGNEFTFVNNRRLQIMAAKDRDTIITYADFGTKNQRVTQIDYTAPSIGIGAGYTARKSFAYTLVVNNYRRDSITWSLV
jgi:hypothetical protein